MAHVFISYASGDRERARALAAALEQQGFGVWWDRHIVAGQTFDEVIERALNGAACVVVLWSASSVKSNWVKTEAAEAAARGNLVPVLMDNVKIPLEFRRVQAANLTDWDGRADHAEFQHFLQALRLEHEQGAARLQSGAVSVAASPAVARAARPPTVTPGAALSSTALAASSSPAPIAAASGARRTILISSIVSAAIAATAVAIWFSSTSTTAIPDVVGLSYEEAASALQTARFIPQRQEQVSTTDRPGTIVAQTPSAGTMLAAGSVVTVTVVTQPQVAEAADDREAAVITAAAAPEPVAEPSVVEPPPPPPVTIPDLRGQTVDDAMRLLTEAGLTVGTRSDEASNDAGLGTVMVQRPPASETAPVGSAIDIVVIARRVTPTLTGLSLDEARKTLTDLGLTTRVERVRANRGERDDVVVGQEPDAGQPVDSGSAALLRVATTTPKRLFGGEELYKTQGRRCVQVCQDAGLIWKNEWTGGSTNLCTCHF